MKLYGKLDDGDITDISYNLKAFEEYDDTTKEAVSMYNIYVPFEENLDAPYNCTIVEDDIFFKNGKYYYEPDNSVAGERTFEYKEGKLVKQQFKPY